MPRAAMLANRMLANRMLANRMLANRMLANRMLAEKLPKVQDANVITGEDILLTVNEVAKLARVCPRTIHRWDSLGQVPGRIKLPGRMLRWRRDAILRWLSGVIER